ncbi:DUF5988 family protein [Paractinoplanes hotanensis]|uniref:DUF5988 family protein n=1 Tax=Paractinoplanes hotanensis TaxID=2906497 RepID=A0ABT0YG63_9ACTN|nr:DUF5988 family protein [Actinoplanes hotanensis]MCM4085072.1 DUF5988 family protein [Actinoplanes hotanensis]
MPEVISERGQEVVLLGGPAELPAEARRVVVTPADDKVKIRFGSGYEHFERLDGTADFTWTMRTKVAE